MIRRRKRRLLTLTATLAEVARNVHNEARDIEVVHQPIYLRSLPEGFEGYTIVQLSDVHHGSLVEAAHIRTAVGIINQLEPDLVVLTGDYVTHSLTYIGPCAELLGQLRAEDGVFAVLGNHDFWTDADKMVDAFKQQRVGVLRNTHTHLHRNGSSLALVGVDDSTTRQDDLRAALPGVPLSAPTILLSHNPNLIGQAAHMGVDLVLSGHTHGGQIRLTTRSRPRQRWLKFWRGHGQLGKTQIYVNRGLGTVIVPVRYQCPPEITVIELRRQRLDLSHWSAEASEADDATGNPR
ncbi:MAG: metallophosphoesterase [Acidobacteria bacterium]|nr:metallophosphoesterase [Acidobacteriota bacterium]